MQYSKVQDVSSPTATLKNLKVVRVLLQQTAIRALVGEAELGANMQLAVKIDE